MPYYVIARSPEEAARFVASLTNRTHAGAQLVPRTFTRPVLPVGPYPVSAMAGAEAPCFTLLGLVLSGLGGLAVGALLGGLAGWAIANAMQVGTAMAPVGVAMMKKIPLAAAAAV